MNTPPSLKKWLDRPWVADSSVFLLYTLLSVVFTWPLATGLAELAPAHFDPPFTAWRLGWIAHQLGHPGHLFDGNIFWPDRRTLAYSDAVLLQGVLGAPLAALGVNPNGIANGLMLLAITTLGVLRLPARGAAHRTPRRRHRRRPGVRVLVVSTGAPAAPGAAVGAVDAAGVLGLAPAARHRADAGRAALRRRGAAAAAVEPLLRGLPGHRPRRRRRHDADRAPRPAGRTGPRRAVRRRGHRRRRGDDRTRSPTPTRGPGSASDRSRRRRATAPHWPAS